MERREFLSLVAKALPGAAVASAGAGTYAIAVEPSWIEVRRVRVPVRGLAPALDGLRVVQLSDIHRSDWVGGGFVREAVEAALALRPDVVALTGDFITDDARYFALVARELAPLAAAAPAFAVPGNHDYGHAYPWSRPELPDGAARLRDALGAEGIELLHNERRIATARGGAAVEIVGLDDFWSPRYDVERAFDGAAADDARPFRLVLSHNPASFRSFRERSFDLVLSGHTHGGQVKVPLLDLRVMPVEDPRFVAGLVAAEGRLVYVNRGLGFSRRIRFGVRPEVTLLEFAAAS